MRAKDEGKSDAQSSAKPLGATPGPSVSTRKHHSLSRLIGEVIAEISEQL